MNKKTAQELTEKMFKKHCNCIQFAIFDLAKVTGPSEKILLDGGTMVEAEKAMLEARQKYRKN